MAMRTKSYLTHTLLWKHKFQNFNCKCAVCLQPLSPLLSLFQPFFITQDEEVDAILPPKGIG